MDTHNTHSHTHAAVHVEPSPASCVAHYPEVCVQHREMPRQQELHLSETRAEVIASRRDEVTRRVMVCDGDGAGRRVTGNTV